MISWNRCPAAFRMAASRPQRLSSWCSPTDDFVQRVTVTDETASSRTLLIVRALMPPVNSLGSLGWSPRRSSGFPRACQSN